MANPAVEIASKGRPAKPTTSGQIPPAYGVARGLTAQQRAELLAVEEGWQKDGVIPEWIAQMPHDGAVMLRQRCYWEAQLGPFALEVRRALQEQGK